MFGQVLAAKPNQSTETIQQYHTITTKWQKPFLKSLYLIDGKAHAPDLDRPLTHQVPM